MKHKIKLKHQTFGKPCYFYFQGLEREEMDYEQLQALLLFLNLNYVLYSATYFIRSLTLSTSLRAIETKEKKAKCKNAGNQKWSLGRPQVSLPYLQADRGHWHLWEI